MDKTRSHTLTCTQSTHKKTRFKKTQHQTAQHEVITHFDDHLTAEDAGPRLGEEHERQIHGGVGLGAVVPEVTNCTTHELLNAVIVLCRLQHRVQQIVWLH